MGHWLDRTIASWHAHPGIVALFGFFVALYRDKVRYLIEWPFRLLGKRVKRAPSARSVEIEYARKSTNNLVLLLAWKIFDGLATIVVISVVGAVITVSIWNFPFQIFWLYLVGGCIGLVFQLRDFVKDLMRPPAHVTEQLPAGPDEQAQSTGYSSSRPDIFS